MSSAFFAKFSGKIAVASRDGSSTPMTVVSAVTGKPVPRRAAGALDASAFLPSSTAFDSDGGSVGSSTSDAGGGYASGGAGSGGPRLVLPLRAQVGGGAPPAAPPPRGAAAGSGAGGGGLLPRPLAAAAPSAGGSTAPPSSVPLSASRLGVDGLRAFLNSGAAAVGGGGGGGGAPGSGAGGVRVVPWRSGAGGDVEDVPPSERPPPAAPLFPPLSSAGLGGAAPSYPLRHVSPLHPPPPRSSASASSVVTSAPPTAAAALPGAAGGRLPPPAAGDDSFDGAAAGGGGGADFGRRTLNYSGASLSSGGGSGARQPLAKATAPGGKQRGAPHPGDAPPQFGDDTLTLAAAGADDEGGGEGGWAAAGGDAWGEVPRGGGVRRARNVAGAGAPLPPRAPAVAPLPPQRAPNYEPLSPGGSEPVLDCALFEGVDYAAMMGGGGGGGGEDGGGGGGGGEDGGGGGGGGEDGGGGARRSRGAATRSAGLIAPRTRIAGGVTGAPAAAPASRSPSPTRSPTLSAAFAHNRAVLLHTTVGGGASGGGGDAARTVGAGRLARVLPPKPHSSTRSVCALALPRAGASAAEALTLVPENVAGGGASVDHNARRAREEGGKLFFSRKPRHTNYSPHTLADYRELQVAAMPREAAPQVLGPAAESSERDAAAEKRRRARAYAEAVAAEGARERARPAGAPPRAPPPPPPPPLPAALAHPAHAAKSGPLSAAAVRERALEYARSVPPPRAAAPGGGGGGAPPPAAATVAALGGITQRPPAPGPRREVALAAAASKRTGGAGWAAAAAAREAQGAGESLIDLEVRHERLREEAEAIRRELSLG